MRPSLAFVFALIALASPARAADPRVADSLQPFVEKNQLAGAVVLVASPDKVLTVETVGFADRETKTAMKPDNLFWIASMTKPMTAAALMMLVDEGKVALDDPVEKYLPEFKPQWMIAFQDKDAVLLKKPTRVPTVRDCLRHTSGMPFVSALESPTIDKLLLKDAVGSYAITPLQYEPGTKYVYSNAGINTAGRIIEVASGLSYEDFMAKRLFAPLGMTETTWRPTSEQQKRLAKTYRPGKDGKGLEAMPISPLAYPLGDPTRHPCPGGGLFSTAKDVAAFGQMILRGGMYGEKRLLSEASIRAMTGTQTNTLLDKAKGESGYGLGLSTTRKAKADGPAVAGPCGHGGAFATNVWINPDSKLVTVYMVQHAGFPGDGGKARPAFEKAAADIFGK
ncbi:beta-lactamase family protein [Gemmata sp. G18]|uniref:Beta-lactamase family protein n=1 Tax=Gemmata palustris TaxID=2822762 RepID=A0ABS5BQK6_9BACT|nr:serine hydrolase domain-containing protein [Gemmata palustris]MBP3955931.1 beta-lactamase family protein [Gemmata palustris]